MGTRVFAVRVGDKYGPEFEDYINSKIPNVTWIREEKDGLIKQWNKLQVMSMDIDEPVVVLDIDMKFINDYMDAIDYPIQRGEFLAGKSWWKEAIRGNFSLQGGFQKYYPKDCKYIYDEFIKNKSHWERFYIDKGITIGPVNGEQYFVEEQVKKKLKLKFLPESWFISWRLNPNKDWLYSMNINYPGDYMYLDGEYNPDIKIIHYANQYK